VYFPTDVSWPLLSVAPGSIIISFPDFVLNINLPSLYSISFTLRGMSSKLSHKFVFSFPIILLPFSESDQVKSGWPKPLIVLTSSVFSSPNLIPNSSA